MTFLPVASTETEALRKKPLKPITLSAVVSCSQQMDPSLNRPSMSKELRAIVNRSDFLPLRYPGGKRRLAATVAELVKQSGDEIKLLVEPFAGGAAVSIAMLENGVAQEIALADKDELIAAFWATVFSDDATELAERVQNAQVTLEEWYRIKNLQHANAFENNLDRAYACLFLNRTSFSGILHRKVGPIGGHHQTSKYKVDCRFNHEALSRRISELSELRDRVRFVRHQSYDKTISDINKLKLSRETPESLLWYFDPPFFEKADQLYRHIFLARDHARFKENLKRLRGHWILSYDNVPDAKRLYGDHLGYSEVSLMYSAGFTEKNRAAGNEIVVSDIIATLKQKGHATSTK
ncbi:DNA adenine methylase [Deinococcus aquatilis]|uniref:DNA adenine methylase n=1 Tax=Deinococcus aquatilis TaxID=519440 RepID=UPI0003769085|nr:DNA adenine methylase [Deinococcus aquatilis]